MCLSGLFFTGAHKSASLDIISKNINRFDFFSFTIFIECVLFSYKTFYLYMQIICRFYYTVKYYLPFLTQSGRLSLVAARIWISTVMDFVLPILVTSRS